MRVREGELAINYILPTTIRVMALASFHVLPLDQRVWRAHC
jgi:hypothetical protein